jgi:hypothetical protein
MAVDEGAVEQVALPETMLGVVHKEVVRCAAAEALVAAAGVQTQQMVAKRFHVQRPKPPDFDVQRHILTHGILADSSSASHPRRHIVQRTILLQAAGGGRRKKLGAAIDGRLPRGFGVKRLMDLRMAWSDQWSALGLKDPAQATFSSAI